MVTATADAARALLQLLHVHRRPAAGQPGLHRGDRPAHPGAVLATATTASTCRSRRRRPPTTARRSRATSTSGTGSTTSGWATYGSPPTSRRPGGSTPPRRTAEQREAALVLPALAHRHHRRTRRVADGRPGDLPVQRLPGDRRTASRSGRDALQDWVKPGYERAPAIIAELGEYAGERGVVVGIEPVDHWETGGTQPGR